MLPPEWQEIFMLMGRGDEERWVTLTQDFPSSSGLSHLLKGRMRLSKDDAYPVLLQAKDGQAGVPPRFGPRLP